MKSERRVLVVGAGLAGLTAAVAARESGASVTVLERHDAPGGATMASVGWIWRYRDLESARTCAPHGDPELQRAIVDRLDDDIAWLVRHGVRPRVTGTDRALTDGVRIDASQALDALLQRLGEDAIVTRTSVRAARRASDGRIELCVRRGRPGALVDEPDSWLEADAVVFAGGGYAADLERVASESGTPAVAADEWQLRAPRAGDGSSMDAAMSLGALRIPSNGECLARIVPQVSRALDARELGRFSELHLSDSVLRGVDDQIVERPSHDWSGAQAVWRLARTSGAGRLELSRGVLRRELRSGTVEDVLRAAVAAGAESGRSSNGGVWLAVQAGITHTLCGLRVDAEGRVHHLVVPRGLVRRQPAARPLGGAFAAGCDAAGAGLGGTASGLAQALVLGRSAGTLAATGG